MSRWTPPWVSRSLGELVHEGKTRPLMVWRVENEKGLGPYQGTPEEERLYGDDPKYPDKQVQDRTLYRFVVSGDRFSEGRDTPKMARDARDTARWIVSSALHPTPEMDFDYGDWYALPDQTKKQYKFGFPTKGAAIDWFGTKRLREFEAKGYKIKQVPASRVVISRSTRQVAYVPWGSQYISPPKNYLQKFLEEMEAGRRRQRAYENRMARKKRRG